MAENSDVQYPNEKLIALNNENLHHKLDKSNMNDDHVRHHQHHHHHQHCHHSGKTLATKEILYPDGMDIHEINLFYVV